MLAGTGPTAYVWGKTFLVHEQIGWLITGTNHALYHMRQDSAGTHGWENLGGYLTSSPAATSTGTGVIDIFACGSNGALWTRHYAGGAWGAWTSFGGQIPSSTGPAACVGRSTGREDVFAQGMNGALWQNTWTGSWSGWQSLGEGITSSPAATAPGSGMIDSLRVATTVLSGAGGPGTGASTWAPWYKPLPAGLLAGKGPAVSAEKNSTGLVQDVFVTGNNGALYWSRWTNAAGYPAWKNLGGKLTSSPRAAAYDGGILTYFFVRGGDGTLWDNRIWVTGYVDGCYKPRGFDGGLGIPGHRSGRGAQFLTE